MFYEVEVHKAAERELQKIAKKNKQAFSDFVTLCEYLSDGTELPTAARYKSVGNGAFEFSFGPHGDFWCRGLLERNKQLVHIYCVEPAATIKKKCKNLQTYQSQRRKFLVIF